MAGKIKEKSIDEMDATELAALCHGEICESDDCCRECERGCRFCIQCIHGSSQRADDFYVAAKKRLVSLLKAARKGAK